MTIKVCLCMIVKNESNIIERCLDSCLGVVDYVSVVDTGSTDDTAILIDSWGKRKGIPTKVSNCEFKNFGFNRTHSYKEAIKSFPDSDYVILIDADMVLKTNGKGIDKNNLKDASYMLRQVSESLSYWNLRILRTKSLNGDNLEWECKGVTHEFWACNNSSTIKDMSFNTKLENPFIDDREDGGCKSDKYERDLRLLKDAYEYDNLSESMKTRYTYYIAQTYEGLGMYEKAIDWYRKRSSIKESWEEEAWYALYKAGGCMMHLKRYEEGVLTLLEAWDRRPSRIESIYKVICHYRCYEKYNISTLLCEKAIQIASTYERGKHPDLLFVEKNIYEYKLFIELAISAWYIPSMRHTSGQSAANKLKELVKGIDSEHDVNHIKSVLKFYS